MIHKLGDFILGSHPNNTFFSFNWHNVKHINAFFKRVSKSFSERDLVVADIGGGRSPYFPYFASIAKEYIVVDFAEALPKHETRPIRQKIGTAEQIPLEDSSVDIVLCNQVLEHVIDPVQSVAEIYRILKPGGHFLGSVPHVSPIHLEPYDFRRYTALGVEQLLQKAGFNTRSVEGNGGVFSAAALMISMDLLLSKRVPGQPQKFCRNRSIILFPLIGFLNIAGLCADAILGDKGRTPANLCWDASKHKRT